MNIFSWILVACWTVFILYWLISSFNTKRDIRGGFWLRSWWARFVLIVIVIAWLSGSFEKNYFVHDVLLHTTQGNPLLAAVGAILNVAGIALAIWARVYLGRNWSPAPAVKEGHELVTTGPYELIRHPIYTGMVIATLGSAIVAPSWFVVFIIVTAMFIWRVHVEESLMTEQFPNQYPDYKKRTWALIPWVW